jgi:ATP-binding cassette, subfamily B, bacterial
MRDWWRLLRHVTAVTVRTDRRTAVVLCVLVAGQAGVIAAVGLSQRWLVDGSAAGQVRVVVWAVVLGVAGYVVASATGRVQSNLLIYLVGRVRAALNEETQRAVSSIPTVTHLEHWPYINRWDRIFQSSQSIAAMPWSTLDAVAATAGLVVTVGLLAGVSPALCLLVLLAVPLFLANRRADRLLREAHDGSTEALRQEKRLHEMCVRPEPAKEVMLTGSGDALSVRAARLWDEAAKRDATARLRGAAGQFAAWVLYAGGLAVALVVVAGLIGSGRATAGMAVMVVSLATQLQNQLRTVLANLSTVAEAGEVVGHYWWLQRYRAEQMRPGDPAPAALTGGIGLHDVRFRYPGADHDVLHGVSLRLPAGRTVAVVGANGAGKSTLIKLLTGVYEPTGGRITVNGRPLPEIDRDGWRSRLSGVYQDFARIRLRLRETVGVGHVRHIRNRAVITDAIGRAGAAEVLDRLPHGMDTQLGVEFGGVEPSLGQWQRLALARSLMREVAGDQPPLCVVLDEPTAALDPLAEHELFRHFVAQVRAATRQGAVTVLVSHRFTTVRMADLIVVLDDGRITEHGSHAELMAAGGGYAELYRLQERAYR